MYTVVFHPGAEQDFLEAYLWYEERSPGLGDRFSRLVERQIKLVSENPEHYPKKKAQYRESKTDIFSYLIVYKVYPDTGIVSYEQKREIQEKEQEMQNNHYQGAILNTLLGKVSEDYMPNIPHRRKKKKKHEHRQGLVGL